MQGRTEDLRSDSGMWAIIQREHGSQRVLVGVPTLISQLCGLGQLNEPL